jgi:nitrogen regulatory protein PII-like uncharacterized protein
MKSLKALLFIVIFCVSITSCQVLKKLLNDKKSDRVFTTKTYEQKGFGVSHPDNWNISEDEDIEGSTRYINIEDADNTVFIVTLFPTDFETDLKQYAENIKKDLPANIPVGEVSATRVSDTSRNILGKLENGTRHNFSLTFVGQKIPHTREFFKIEGGKNDAVVMIQAPDEDWQAAEKEFKVMFDSLKFE